MSEQTPSFLTKILLVNGPNLNRLGEREPEIYGATTLKEIEEQVANLLQKHPVTLHCMQSNHEGVLIDFLHEHHDAAFLIMNPGAFTHTSVALRDAVLSIGVPMVEVHLSNVFQRESFRHHSYFSDIAVGSVIGLGISGYEYATLFALRTLNEISHT